MVGVGPLAVNLQVDGLGICGGFGPPLRAKLQVDGGEKCDGFRALKTQLETETSEPEIED